MPTKTPPRPAQLEVPEFFTPTMCDHCGIVDNHPKLHYTTQTFHHDCTPVPMIGQILAGAHSQHALLVAKIFRAAREEDVHGDDLRDMINGLQMKDFGDAQMLKATAFANDVLDATFQNGASGTFALGATTYTLPLKCIFMSTVSTAGTQGTEWSTSGGYTAGGVALNGLFTAAASAAAKANTGAVTVSNAPSQTWADNEVKDSTGTPKRMVFKGTPSLAKTVNSGDTCTIPIGSLTGAET